MPRKAKPIRTKTRYPGIYKQEYRGETKWLARAQVRGRVKAVDKSALFDNQAEAREHLPELVALARAEANGTRTAPPTLGDCARRYCARQAKRVDAGEIRAVTVDQEVENLTRLLDALDGNTLVSAIDVAKAMSWIDKLRPDYGEITLGHRVRLLRRVLREAVIAGWLPANPFEAVPAKFKSSKRYTESDPNLLSPTQVARLLAAIREPQWHLMARLLFVTGLRGGEARGLQWPDMDWERGVLAAGRTISRGHIHEDGKNDAADRLIPLDPVTLDLLRRHHEARTSDVWMFAQESGAHYSGNPVAKRLPRWLRDAGIRTRITTHGTRRTYNDSVKRTIEQDPHQLAALRATMGHSTEEMTAHYSVRTLADKAVQQALWASRIDAELARLASDPVRDSKSAESPIPA